MTTGTGLDAQFGIALETTVGTAATPDTFLEFNSEGIAYDPGFVEPTGLRVGQKFKRGARLVKSRDMVTGPVNLNHATNGFGILWKLCLGSSVTTPTQITGAAYTQHHTTGDLQGKSATVQVGRPEPYASFTVKPHTYSGCKVTSWEFSVADNDVAKLNVEFDGWAETTATTLGTASFVTGAEEFSFADVSDFELGGTVTESNGVLSWTSGTDVTSIVKSFTLRGDNALATERFGLGNGGTKAEQLENGVPTITGTLEAEYKQDEFYAYFKANTAKSLRLKLTGSAIGTSGSSNSLEFIIPEVRFKSVTPQVGGPDIVMASAEFEVYADESNNPLQVTIVSSDSSAL